MFGKGELQKFIQESDKSEKISVAKENEKFDLTENDSSKVVIQVNLGKQSCQQDDFTQIIREIFELSNYVVEVEKVVLPTGENTWQVRKMEYSRGKESADLPTSASVDLAEKRQKLSTKLMKHNKLCKIKLVKSLNRSRQGSRKKLSGKISRELGLGQFGVSEVHSSSAITNLLSQLYPNPYNLISLLEVQSKQNSMASKGAVDASDSCNINFKERDKFCKESDAEQEFATFSVPDVTCTKIYGRKIEKQHLSGMGERKSVKKDCAAKRESAVERDLFTFTGLSEMQPKVEDVNTGRKTNIMTINSGGTTAGTHEAKLSQEISLGSKHCEDNPTEITSKSKSDLSISVVCDSRKKSKITTVDLKMTRKKRPKAPNPTTEKIEEEKNKLYSSKPVPPSGGMVSISTIHPFSLHKANFNSEGNKREKEKLKQQPTVKKPAVDKNSSAGAKPTAAKKKCVMQYLKLIKDMYEAEERCLQNKIDDAWNFALDQMEKPDKKPTKNQQIVQNTTKEVEGKFKNSQSQTPKPKKVIMRKKKFTVELDQKSGEPTEAPKKSVIDNNRTSGTVEEPSISCTEIIPKSNLKMTEEDTSLLKSAWNEIPEPSCSMLHNHRKNSQLAMLNNSCSNFGVYTKTPNAIRMDTFVFSRTIQKNNSKQAEGLPIEVINRNVLETNRKIDLLIRHIDNSMDWLSQSEKTEPSNMNSLIEKAKDLSEKLEENLRAQKPSFIALSEKNIKSMRLHENSTVSCNRSDLLLTPSYQSLHFFPVHRSIGSVRIRTGAFFNNDLTSTRSRNSLWLSPTPIRPSSLGNIMLPHSRSVNYLTSNDSTVIRNYEMPGVEQGRGFQRRIESEVPELQKTTEPAVIYVENSNELGSFAEDSSHICQNKKTPTKIKNISIDLAGVCDRSNSDAEKENPEKNSTSSLSISIVAMDESASALRPVVVEEITWGFALPVPSPVTGMHYRNERHMVFTTMEAIVLHVARATSFLDLALISVVQVVEQEPKQQSSVIISLHKCSSFIKNNDELNESGQVSKFVVIPSETNYTENNSCNILASDEEAHGMNIKILKSVEHGADRGRKEIGRCNWDLFQSESSLEIYGGDKATIGKMDDLLNRPNKLERHGKNLTWLQQLADPYESNPADVDTGNAVMKQTNFRALRSGPHQTQVGDGQKELFPDMNDWDRRKLKFGSLTPPIFRYLSSETSNTSLDEKNGNTTSDIRKKSDHSRKISKLSSTDIPPFPDINKSSDNPALIEQKVPRGGGKQEEDDSSSTSSFKSSNDFSDVSELPELSYPKKRPKSRSHFLDKLFHELRSFRKCLIRQRGSKRKTVQDEPNEFEDALSELNMEIQQENKVLMADDKQTADGAVAMKSICIDEVGSHAMPRKIFKTSFRGKESVTELMIDLKDVSISEVSDISVEKRKLSTDHTKISIIISKQSGENGPICCANQDYRKGEGGPSREGSCHSLKNTTKMNCIDWRKEASKSDDDADHDDDYKSVDSGTNSKSLENIPDKKLQRDTDFRAKMLVRDALIEPRRRMKTFGRHKFDFYKKMEDTTSFDSLKLDGNELLFTKYEKEIAPLKKALADMQFRVQNIQKNTFCTSDEYYERALKMAKMSAGYCQSCKSKTVIPEDPLGIYQKLIPRTSLRRPYSKHRKYYFKATSSTNSSFYSIHSSNSDVSDKFCHLNSSSSIVTNGLSRNRGPMLRESTDSNIPLFFGRTVHF